MRRRDEVTCSLQNEMGDVLLSIAGLVIAAVAAVAGPVVTFWIWRSNSRSERKSSRPGDTDPGRDDGHDSARRWLSPETRYLASSSVRHDLSVAGNNAAVAVDGAVVLYRPSGEQLNHGKIDFHVEATNPRPIDLIRPEPAALRSAVLADVVDEHTREYLLGLIPVQRVDELYRVKVALRDIRWPLERYRRPLALTIGPLSYWVVQQFNRHMVQVLSKAERGRSDRRLMSLRKRALDGMLAPGQDLSIRCPSPLYVEVAVVTSDDYLVCLTKKPEHSIYATTGRQWTCSIEEGAEWDDVVDGRLDFIKVVRSGAWKELSIADGEISRVWFDAIVLEHPNLSTAVVGTMALSIPKSEIPLRVAASPDFGDVRFVHVSKATREIFGPKPILRKNDAWWHEASWHPTARLRALFCLYHYIGREEALRGIILRSSRWRSLGRS